MASVFDALKSYAGKWSEKSRRVFTDQEIAEVESAQVVTSTFGLSVEFHMKTSEVKYIPLSTTSSLGLGPVHVDNLMILSLSKPGEDDIIKVVEK